MCYNCRNEDRPQTSGKLTFFFTQPQPAQTQVTSPEGIYQTPRSSLWSHERFYTTLVTYPVALPTDFDVRVPLKEKLKPSGCSFHVLQFTCWTSHVKRYLVYGLVETTLKQVKGQTDTYWYQHLNHIFTASLVRVPVQVSTDLSTLMAQRLKMEAVHSITSMVIRQSQRVVLKVHTPSWNWNTQKHAQYVHSYSTLTYKLFGHIHINIV